MLERVTLSASVDIAHLDQPGQVRLVDVPGFENAFIARVKSATPPPGSVPAGQDGEYFVAFSRLCTHMGAHLLGPQHEALTSIEQEGVVRCPAHLTCFDLCHDGLVVVGQACSNLPRIDLAEDAPGRVRLVRWAGPGYGEVSR